MSIFKTTKYINFHNATEFPVNISAWVTGSNTLHSNIVNPGEKGILHSSVGEWHMDSMFCSDMEESKIWKERGLQKHLIIGKFRSEPCISGEYSFMEYDEPFSCVYTATPGRKIAGTITFMMK